MLASPSLLHQPTDGCGVTSISKVRRKNHHKINTKMTILFTLPSGLDPAGPCFRYSGPEKRLSEDDAIFVDAIHTDGDHTLQAGEMDNRNELNASNT